MAINVKSRTSFGLFAITTLLMSSTAHGQSNGLPDCTAEIIDAKAADLPEVIVVKDANNLSEHFETWYECSLPPPATVKLVVDSQSLGRALGWVMEPLPYSSLPNVANGSFSLERKGYWIVSDEEGGYVAVSGMDRPTVSVVENTTGMNEIKVDLGTDMGLSFAPYNPSDLASITGKVVLGPEIEMLPDVNVSEILAQTPLERTNFWSIFGAGLGYTSRIMAEFSSEPSGAELWDADQRISETPTTLVLDIKPDTIEKYRVVLDGYTDCEYSDEKRVSSWGHIVKLMCRMTPQQQ